MIIRECTSPTVSPTAVADVHLPCEVPGSCTLEPPEIDSTSTAQISISVQSGVAHTQTIRGQSCRIANSSQSIAGPTQGLRVVTVSGQLHFKVLETPGQFSFPGLACLFCLSVAKTF